MPHTDQKNKTSLLLNIGNSRTQIGLLQGAEMKYLGTFRTASWKLENEGQLPVAIQPYSQLPCAVACVVPGIAAFLQHCYRDRESELRFISPATVTEIDFSMVDAATIGADRIANAAAVADRGLIPAIVVDCGTAVTLEVINTDKQFCGGAILPGRMLQRRALSKHTALLPQVPVADEPVDIPGRSTDTAIMFGIDQGMLGALDRIIRKSLATISPKADPKKVNIIATGGDAEFFCRHLPILNPAPDYLTLHGLAAIARKLQEKLDSAV